MYLSSLTFGKTCPGSSGMLSGRADVPGESQGGAGAHSLPGTAQGGGEGSSHCCLPPSPVPQKSCLHAPARGRLLLKGRSLPCCWELTILHVKTCFCCVWCTTTQIAAELKPLGKTREPLIRGCSSHCQAGNGEGMLFALPTQRGGKEKSIYSSKVGSFS